jgi:hypothetical protein
MNPDGTVSVDLGGKSVVSCSWDKGNGFVLGIGEAESSPTYEVQAGGPFTLKEHGQTQKIDAGASALPPTHLLERRVARAEIAVDGTLTVHFVDGTVLRCDAQLEYEAWQINGPNGLLIVALPGGEFAFWAPR